MPFELRNLQYNALSTHDIVRFISRVDLDEQRYRQAAVLQMAWPGVPAVYYGEELGLAGGKDPDNRRPMPWADVPARRGLLEFLARLIGLRRSLKPLRQGAFRFLAADEDCLAFTRFEGEQVLIVAANRGHRPQPLELPVAWLGLRDGEAVRSLISSGSAAVRMPMVAGGRLKMILGPREAVWLERAAGAEVRR